MNMTTGTMHMHELNANNAQRANTQHLLPVRHVGALPQVGRNLLRVMACNPFDGGCLVLSVGPLHTLDTNPTMTPRSLGTLRQVIHTLSQRLRFPSAPPRDSDRESKKTKLLHVVGRQEQGELRHSFAGIIGQLGQLLRFLHLYGRCLVQVIW